MILERKKLKSISSSLIQKKYFHRKERKNKRPQERGPEKYAVGTQRDKMVIVAASLYHALGRTNEKGEEGKRQADQKRCICRKGEEQKKTAWERDTEVSEILQEGRL